MECPGDGKIFHFSPLTEISHFSGITVSGSLIKVNPKAAKSEIKKTLTDETVKINIASLPEKGKANAELIKILSKEFCVEKNRIKITSGSKNRLKLVKITT